MGAHLGSGLEVALDTCMHKQANTQHGRPQVRRPHDWTVTPVAAAEVYVTLALLCGLVLLLLRHVHCQHLLLPLTVFVA